MGHPESRLHRTCTRCMTTTAWGHESPLYWVDATIPCPPCSAPAVEHGEPSPQSAPLRTERLPIKRHPHDLRGHPVEGGDELLKHLKVRQDQASVMLELQRSQQCLLVPHVVEPVFRTMAEESSRFRRTHILEQPRIV